MNDKQKSNTVSNDPTRILLKIVQGDVENLHIPMKTVVTAKKIRNIVLRKFITKYKQLNKLTDSQLIDILLAFDEVTEKELLTDELLSQIRKDPTILDKYLNKKDK